MSFSYGSSPRDREYSVRSKFQINLSRVNAPETQFLRVNVRINSKD